MIWYILGSLYIIGMIWLAYEAYNAPLYPEDYDKDRPN